MQSNQFFLKKGPFSLKEIIKNINCTGDFLKKQEDPHIYFPFKLPAHYNEKGYQKLAEHISKEIIKK